MRFMRLIELRSFPACLARGHNWLRLQAQSAESVATSRDTNPSTNRCRGVDVAKIPGFSEP